MTTTGAADGPNFNIQTGWGDRSTEIIPDVAVQLPLSFTASIKGLPIEVAGVVDLVGDRLGCTKLTVTGSAGEAVTGERLRQVPVADLMARAVRAGLVQTKLVDDGKLRVTTPVQLEPPEGFPKSGPTEEALQFIALVYQLAYVLGESPTKAVAQLGMPYATAARWVSRAREASYLSRTAPGRAGGIKLDQDDDATSSSAGND